MSLSVCVRMRACVGVCRCVCVRVACVCVCVCVYVSVCVGVCISVAIVKRSVLPLYVAEWALCKFPLSLFYYACERTRASVCVCAHVCARVPVCMRACVAERFIMFALIYLVKSSVIY